MSKPTIWKCVPCKANGVKTDVVSGQPETGRRVKIVDAAGIEWANRTYGTSLSMPKDGNTSGGSALPHCAPHYAAYLAAKDGFLDGDRAKSRNVETSAVTVAAIKAHEAGDEAGAAADEAKRHWTAAAWQAVTAEDMAWINRAAYGKRAMVADTEGLYDAMLDALVKRTAEYAGRTGHLPVDAERTTILRGLLFGVMPTSKGDSVQTNGTRVYGLISLDAVSSDEDGHGATLADALTSEDGAEADTVALHRALAAEFADEDSERGEAAREYLALTA